MTTETLILAFALFLIFEGLGPALFPKKWQQMLQQLSVLPFSQLRVFGIVLIVMGWLLFISFKP